jgi:effector-binding domain-containing protein
MSVSIETVSSRPVATVRRRMRQPEIAQKFFEPLDEVWAFVRGQPRLLDRGRNIFIYTHPKEGCADGMQIDFGVEVTREFPDAGEVRCVHLPSGRAACALHVGPYNQLAETHSEVHRWCAANRHAIADRSWEIYGHWADDPAKLETWVCYLLK